MRPAAPSVYTRVAEDCAELAGLLARLEAEVPEKKRNPHGGYGSGKGGHHSPAWNAPAAMLVMDIHYGVRELETNLRYQIAGTVRSRGMSAGNTQRSLDALPGLCAGLDQAAGRQAIQVLESWINRSRMILGDAEPMSRLPRLPGQSEPLCPYCRGASLRYRPYTGSVKCIRPGCRDSNGNKPSGALTVGQYSGQPMLAWADGTSGAHAAAG